MSHQINKDAIREAIGIDEDYYVAIWRADGNKDKQLNKIILSNLIENLNTKNYANYDLTFTGNRIHNVANYTITHNNSASYAYNLIAASAYSVGITTTTAAFRVSDGGMTIGSKSTVPTKVLDVVGDARIRTVSNDNALTNLLAIDANGNVFYRTSSSLAPSSAALTKTDDTNVTLTLGGSPSTALLAAASITVGWTGTLADSRIASASTWNAKIGGSGTTNYISKFTASGTIGNSLIQDDGSNISINNSLQSLYKVYINSDKLVGLGVFNNAASGTNNFGISGSATNANSASNIGVFGNALLSSGGTNLGVRGQSASQTVTDSTSIISAGSNVGGFFQANASSATSYGLVSTADALSNQPSATFIGALLRANNAGTRYAAQLIDGTEGSGKFFKSVTSSGHGNWAAIAATDITSGLGSALQYLRVNSGGTALEYANLSLTFQNVYDASTQPQILTSVAKGGIVIRSGQALDTNSVLELKNIAGSSTFVVGGNGIVANGDWQATAIAAAFGGTGQTSYTIGDLIYASNTTAIAKLGIGTSGQVLTVSGGGIPTWAAVSAPNLGSANLTSADDARTFTLKSGTTATQNFQILNSAGTVGYYFDGANTLNFGDTTKFVKPTIYLDSTLTDQMHIRRGSATFFVLNPLNYGLNLVGPSGNRIDLYGDGQVYVKGPSAGYFSDNTAGQRIYRQDIQSGTDCYVVMASGSNNKSVFYAGYGNYLIDNVAIGDTYTFTEKFKVKGAGSTSATTTVLFQNSASTNIFKVLDNGNTILNLPSTVAADGDLFNNGVNLYTDGTSLKARYKNNSGTASDLAIGSNIYNTSSTITDDARTVTLKSGGTASQYLQITNGVDDVIRFRGDKQIIIGNNGIKFDPYGITNWAILQYLAAGTTYAWNVYSVSNQELFRFDSSGMIYAKHTSGIASYMNYNSFINFWASGTSSSIGFVQDNGSNHTVYIGNSGGHGYLDIKNSSGVTKTWLIGNGDSYFLNNLAIGVSSAAARLDVKGSGSTSATTTVLFQNSASTNIFKVLDNGNTILNLPSTVAADGDLFNNGVNLYTDGTSLKARYKNNSGTASDLAIGSNIYNTSSTITDDARTVTLKSGGTATQNLQFLNSGGGNLLTLYGNKNIEFGASSNTLTEFLINLSGTNGTFRMASGSNLYAIYYDAPAFNFSIRSATSYKVDVFGGLGSIVTTGDTSSGYYLNKIAGTPAAALYNNNGSNLYMNNSAGTRLINIETANGFGHVVGGWAVGLAYSIVPTARLQVKGSGATSATTTALFENSSSAKSLEILDSGAINIYNSGGFRTAYLNVYGGGVFGGNNNGTIGADPNNVLGGSYLNGIILGGYTNTHNGYQGVIGGGFNTVTTNGTWNFVFSVSSTASAAAASVFGGSGHTASGAYSAVLGGEQNTASGIGAVAVGGNQASASGYRSFAQGYGSSATSDYAVVMGSYCSAVARSSRAIGEFSVASGISSFVSGLGAGTGLGQQILASGTVSFNHSFNDGTVLFRAAEGNYSAILGGTNHWTKSGSTSSAILGGEGNTINASVVRSVILGGTGITATASDTAYALNLSVASVIELGHASDTTISRVSAGKIAVEGVNVVTISSTDTLTNKRVTPRVGTTTSSATPTINTDNVDFYELTAQAVNITSFTTNLTGTPTNGQKLWIAITGTAARTIAWGASFESSTITLPTTTVNTSRLDVGFVWNSATSKWRCVGTC